MKNAELKVLKLRKIDSYYYLLQNDSSRNNFFNCNFADLDISGCNIKDVEGQTNGASRARNLL